MIKFMHSWLECETAEDVKKAIANSFREWLDKCESAEEAVEKVTGIKMAEGETFKAAAKRSCENHLPEICAEVCRKTEDYWCSFDEKTGNYHAVPCEEDAKAYMETVQKVQEKIEEKIPGCKASGGSQPWTKCHRYNSLKSDDRHEYLISFNRMTCDSENGVISNQLGEVQFYEFPQGKGPNYYSGRGSNRKLIISYPRSGSNETPAPPIERKNGPEFRRVYNPENLSMSSTAEEVAERIVEAFKDFITESKREHDSHQP